MFARIFSIHSIVTGCLVFQVGAAVHFNKDIRPILSDKCFACHGMDEESREAKLRLDTPEGSFRKNSRGNPAIVSGEIDKSEVWLRIISDDEDELMPPPDSHKSLNANEKALIRRWIEEGAIYQKHWAFEAPVMPRIPEGRGNEIDRFVEKGLTDIGWALSPEATRETLIRRVSFTLTGLPPKLTAVEMFLTDQKEGSYGRMVDRYLSSPRYGEEMARHWLDAARYGDTHGMHLDNERQMWAYRDWVIQAFNHNQPYDQFTIDQLAGDLIANAKQDQVVATGFNRCNVTTGEGGSIAEEFVFRYAVDRASTTAQVWLGLTAQCAVCHDHKYDPISQKDFYSLYAFFNSNADPAMDGNKLLTAPVIQVEPEDYDAKMADLNHRIAQVKERMRALEAWSTYRDPAENISKAATVDTEVIWFDDAFPRGAKVGSVGHSVQFVESPVFSGKKSLKRGGTGMAQDYYHEGATAFLVPSQSRFFLQVYLDPNDPPEEVMVQFYTNGWNHRMIWGADVIEFGKKGTSERFVAGKLPKAGQWVRLEVPGEKVGLKPGAMVSGFAFTVHGGTAYFDQMGVIGRGDSGGDPKESFLAWRKSQAGKPAKGIPAPLNQWLKEGGEKKRKPEEMEQLRDYYLEKVCMTLGVEMVPLRADLAQIEAERKAYESGVPSTFVFRDLPKPRQSYVMQRGEYNQPGEKVEPMTPAVLPAMKKAGARGNRLDLAKWLVSAENPLTARVTVNRFWQQIFGTGLVKTSHDFGTQGDLPSHPELLDFLALRFQERQWNVKGLMRELVMTRTFRQQSSAASPRWDIDPENRRLARGPRFRLDAEQLRDQALFVGGLLDLKMGGRGVMPYQPPNIWEPVAFGGSNTRFYKRGSGGDLYRRSIYTFFKRTAPHPMFANFDTPAREQFCLKRERSNTPLQALQLMNDVQHFEAARGLGQRAMKNAVERDGRIKYIFRAVISRVPTEAEMKVVGGFFDKRLMRYHATPEEAKKLIAFGESKPDVTLDVVELAAWTLVSNLILNMDEAIVRN